MGFYEIDFESYTSYGGTFEKRNPMKSKLLNFKD